MKVVRVLESRALYAGAGVSLRDDHTGGPPIGRISLELDVEEAPSVFRPTPLRPLWSAPDTATWPGLERKADARGASPRKYRVRVHAQLYAPHHLLNGPGVELTVHPYDDDLPPAVLPAAPTLIVLLPSAAYPFQPDTPILHGVVEDAGGQRVPSALVECKSDRVLTDEDGAFLLPVRRAPFGQGTAVDAVDGQGRTGTTTVVLPQALAQRHTITVT